MYEIEADVEYPHSSEGKRSKYPLAEMKVGDSFAFPRNQIVAVRSVIALHQRSNPGVKFSALTANRDKGRCWRVA